MSIPSTPHEKNVERLTEAEKKTGRQDLIAPVPTTEKSDPTPVDIQRGKRVWVGITLVGLIFVAVIVYFLVSQ